jgi:hypothetical protein
MSVILELPKDVEAALASQARAARMPTSVMSRTSWSGLWNSVGAMPPSI